MVHLFFTRPPALDGSLSLEQDLDVLKFVSIQLGY